MKSAICVVLGVFAVLPLGAQRFTATVDAVAVDALVMDGNRPVIGLVAGDFELRDTGVLQQIDSIAVADVPVSMMVALDTSASVSGDVLQRLKQGVATAFGMLEQRDRAALITFSSAVRLAHDWAGASAPVAPVLDKITSGGGTSLWDAAFAALTLRDPTPTMRRLVLVFSDGQDTASWLPRQAVLDKAQRSDSVVYAVSSNTFRLPRVAAFLDFRSGIELSTTQTPSWNQTPFLDELTDVTGGTHYATRSAGELRDAFAKILVEFRTRYLITYTPTGVDAGGWHPVEVKLKSKRGTVRARRGYFR